MAEHFGIYGLIFIASQALLVRKTRGPYNNLLDLPGGSPESGEEDLLATLRREIAEETGLTLDAVGPWHEFRFLVKEDSRGEPIEFVHTGLWASASVLSLGQQSALSQISSGDTAGTVWLPLQGWRMRNDLSALTKFVFAAVEGGSN